MNILNKKYFFYFACARKGLAKSKSCNPFLEAVIVQGVLFFIKLDHLASQILHLNSPGAPSGFIVLTTIHLSQRRYNYACFILIGSLDFLSFPLTYLCNVVQKYNTMGDEKKKETKIEKKDEFGNVIEKQEIEEKEED